MFYVLVLVLFMKKIFCSSNLYQVQYLFYLDDILRLYQLIYFLEENLPLLWKQAQVQSSVLVYFFTTAKFPLLILEC